MVPAAKPLIYELIGRGFQRENITIRREASWVRGWMRMSFMNQTFSTSNLAYLLG